MLVGTRATVAEANKSLFLSLEKKAGAEWLLSLVQWHVGLSSGLSAGVVWRGGSCRYYASRQLLLAPFQPEQLTTLQGCLAKEAGGKRGFC